MHESQIMNAIGVTLKEPTVPALSGPWGGRWWLLRRTLHLRALSLTSLSLTVWLVCHSLSCFSYSRNNTLGFQAPVLRLLLGFQSTVDTLRVFLLFLRMVTLIVAPKLTIIFRRLIRLGSLRECWCSANVNDIPKYMLHLSPNKENYRHISIPPFCLRCIRRCFPTNSVWCLGVKCFLPAIKFAYRKGLGCTDTLLAKFAYRKGLGCTDTLLAKSYNSESL